MSPEPYYDDGTVTIYHGNCLDLVEVWVGADVLVTDPPYGIGFTTHGITRTSRANRAAGNYDGAQRPDTKAIQNDHSTETRDLALHAWGDKPGFVFGSLLKAPPHGTRQVAVYVKPIDAGALTGLATLRRDVEAIYLVGRSDEWVPYGQRSSVFQTAVRVLGTPGGIVSKYGHPHAKPVDVLRDLIGLHSGVVADPFMGSGSTLRAAKDLGRKAIGIEIDERYCEVAAKRMGQEVLALGAT